MDRGASPKLNTWAVMQNGPPRDKVDLLLMGDGYTAAEMEKWHRDAQRMAETLFAASPHVRADVDKYEVYAVRFATLAKFPRVSERIAHIE